MIQQKDNQEVYQDCAEETGAILVVEILEHQSDVSNDDASRFFFEDLADSNGCSKPEDRVLHSSSDDTSNLIPNVLKSMQQLSVMESIHCFVSVGSQRVAQGRDTDIADRPIHNESKWIDIEMCALRMKHVETDLLLTLSTPNGNNAAEGVSKGREQHSNAFRSILSSFNVTDWSLFD
eukprot:scaffold2048_cov204-Alexandrium_tamarense.AAC.38